MTHQRFRRPILRYGVCPLLALLTLGCLLFLYCKCRSHRNAQAVAVLFENDVQVGQASQGQMSWCHRSGIRELPAIQSVSLHSQQNLEAIVPALIQLGTVTKLDYYNLTESELRRISKVRSIEVISAQWGGRVEEIRPFLSHRIRDYSVSGADHNIPPESLELLFSLPSIERIGTAHGESSIPDELRRQRPDVSIYVTDFPP